MILAIGAYLLAGMIQTAIVDIKADGPLEIATIPVMVVLWPLITAGIILVATWRVIRYLVGLVLE